MELIILLSLMTAFASSASLDAELCGEGESFWCQSLTNAEACGAVDHCKETVWKVKQLEEEWSLSNASPTEKYRMCQKFFSSLQWHLQTSDSQDVILNLLRVNVCPLMTRGNTDMCVRDLGSILPLILKRSLNFLDHKTICRQLTQPELMEDDLLDQPDFDWSMLHSPLNEINHTIKCAACIHAIDFIEHKIRKNITSVIEESLLTNFCEYINPFKMLCEGFAKLIAPRIVETLNSWMIRVNVCRLMRACDDAKYSASSLSMNQQLQQLLTFKKPNEEKTACQFCRQVFQATISSEAVNRTKATFLSAMRMLCDSPSLPHMSRCHRMVGAVGRSVLQNLSQRLHPTGACAMLGLCDGASSHVDTIHYNGGRP